MTELSILIPVLRRPDNVAPQVANIVDSMPSDVQFEIVFISTNGDTDEHDAILQQAARKDVTVRSLSMTPASLGDYALKINYGVQSTTSQWVFLGADDLNFRPGWYHHAVAASAATGCRVVGTQDMGNRRVIRGQHATHSLVNRSYIVEMGTIDEPGKTLHEGYQHEFVDDEFVETAKHRGEFVFANRSIVEHLHPLWGKAKTDALYDGQRRRMNQGRRVYTKRKPLWR